MQKSWNATRSPFTATARVSRQQRSLPSHEVLARLNSCVLFCSTLKSMCIFLWIKIQLNVIDLNIMKPNSWIRLHTAAPFPWCLACAVVRFQVLHVSGTFWLVFGNWKPSAVQVQEFIIFFKKREVLLLKKSVAVCLGSVLFSPSFHPTRFILPLCAVTSPSESVHAAAGQSHVSQISFS